MFDWSFASLIAPVVTTTSIVLCSNKIQNGDTLVSINPGPRGNMAVKMERERERERDTLYDV